MTTAVADVTIPSPEVRAELVARLIEREAALGAPEDVLLTERAQADYYNKTLLFARTRAELQNTSELDKVTAKLAGRERHRALVAAAQVTLEAQLDAAPDWRTCATNGRDRDREWRRQQDIRAALVATRVGVEYFGGVPAVPEPLVELLGGYVELPDGRRLPPWHGSLPRIDDDVADLREKLAARRAVLATAVAQAEALLSEGSQAGGSLTR